MFNPEKVVTRPGSSILVGKVGETDAMVRFTFPKMDRTCIGDIMQRDHELFLNNDVYQTAKLDMDMDVDMETVHSTEIGRNQFVRESYEDYLRSSPSSDITPPTDECIYEDASIAIVPCPDSNDDVNWMCIFKDTHLQSVRDISNVKEIESIRDTVASLLRSRSVPENHVCMYFDYSGKRTRLVLWTTCISKTLCNLRARGSFIYLDLLVKNLIMDSEYYRKDLSFIKIQGY